MTAANQSRKPQTPDPAALYPQVLRPRRATGRWLAVLMTALLLLLIAPAQADAGGYGRGSSVVVANRGSGDISVIDTRTLEVENVDLPGEAEPMYVNHDTRHGRVLVGDRASSTIVAFDDDSYDVVGSVAVGEGIFHQWLDVRLEQLWVVGTTAQTVSVVDSDDLELLVTMSIPAELIERGGVPHDVFVSGRHAFVSVLGLDDGSGVVIQYSTRTFEETGRIPTGGDPHLFVTGNNLYVASQDASSVSRYRANNLAFRSSASVPAAHGIFVTNRNEVLLTNIAGGGIDAVWELNKRLTTVRDTVDTAVPTPHNLTVDNRRQAFVTHSGATADQVSVIDLNRRGFGEPRLVTVGTNPFGLAFVR